MCYLKAIFACNIFSLSELQHRHLFWLFFLCKNSCQIPLKEMHLPYFSVRELIEKPAKSGQI